MFDLFGSGMPLAARFFIAFLVVLALIGVTAWLVRRFGANRIGATAARGRQPRLAVIDAANVDGRRRLLLIRRDNVEHLLMVGGPTDVLIEPNIVRAAAARDLTREPPRAGTAPDIAVRPAPAVESGWPLQPLTEPPLAPVAPAATIPPAPTPPMPPAPSRQFRPSPTEEPWLAPEPGARPRPPETIGTFASDLAPPAPRSEPPAPRVSAPPPVSPAEPPPPPASAQADQNLAEMALQLEAALRRTAIPEGRPPVSDAVAAQAAAPAPRPPRPPEMPPRPPLREFKPRMEARVEPRFEGKPEMKAEPKLEPQPEAKPEPKFPAWPRPESRAEPKPEPKPAPKPEAKPEPAAAPEKKAEKGPYDNLEEEMASLLGRPSAKS